MKKILVIEDDQPIRISILELLTIEKFEGIGAEDGNEGWKIKLLIFVGGTSGSVNVKMFNDNMQELQVL